MQVYRYKAVAVDGSTVEGVMQAIHSDDVVAALSARDLRVSGIQRSGARWYHRFLPEQRVKAQEVVMYCRQLATFVQVGIPITSAFQTLADQTSNKKLREANLQMLADVQMGVRLSEAMRAHPLVFPRVIPDMVQAAEASGNLEVVLRQAGRTIEREAQFKQKVRSASIYPSIVSVLAIVIGIGILVFVLPLLKGLYGQLDVSMPGLMVGLLAVSSFLKSNGVWILIGLLIVFLACAYWFRQESGRYFLHRLFLRLPVSAPMIRAAVSERFCRTLGDLLTAGVPMVQTFTIVVETTSNRVFQRALHGVLNLMATGNGLAGPLRDLHLFPPMVVMMVSVGEETGRLDVNLREMSEMASEELDYRIKRMTAVIEPALIVFVGCMVGFIAITLFLSIYSLAGGFSG